jgi:hypothetical protein
MRRAIIGLFFFVCIFIQAQQTVSPPLDIPLSLSGNFGELRTNHFHSGIDFKTQQITGLPVRAVKDGYVARVNVSPFGYGNALYINHFDGTTSVYAHLEKFVSTIEKEVRNRQYQQETFAVELYFTPDKIPVKQGERIAWSGNSGGSGGPHLHFEFRNTKTGRVVDALPYFKERIKDTRSPDIRSIRVYPQTSAGIVNESAQNQSFQVLADPSGGYRVPDSLRAWGKIGIGIQAYDKMDGTTNIYGIHEIVLKVDGEAVYHAVMDGFFFEDTRYLNSFIDWNERMETHVLYMKSFTEPGNHLRLTRPVNQGIITIDEERTYQLEYVLTDVFDNTSRLKWAVQGKETPIPQAECIGSYFPYNQENHYAEAGLELTIPKGNLYTDAYLQVDTVSAKGLFSPLYHLPQMPLHSYCSLVLDVTKDDYPEKSKYGIVQYVQNERNWIGGKYENGKMFAELRELATFAVEIDTIPPVIRPVKEETWTVNQRIVFQISDNLRGIHRYKGTLNGQFVLFEYDPKFRSLSCTYDPQRMKKGLQSLVLKVTDKVGNQSEFRTDIKF